MLWYQGMVIDATLLNPDGRKWTYFDRGFKEGLIVYVREEEGNKYTIYPGYDNIKAVVQKCILDRSVELRNPKLPVSQMHQEIINQHYHRHFRGENANKSRTDI